MAKANRLLPFILSKTIEYISFIHYNKHVGNNEKGVCTMNEIIAEYNRIIFEKMSRFINFEADYIRPEFIKSLCEDYGLSKEEAYSIALAGAVDLDTDDPEDEEIYEYYFPRMVHMLERKAFSSDPYLKNIRIPDVTLDKWELCHKKYAPYQAFVFDDPKLMRDGRIIPQIGFFDKEFSYPAVLENGVEWMLITPNEINTMRSPIERARGNVLTYGLGLGYFAYMASQKRNVKSVTVIERDKSVISLFNEIILPQFPHKEKINIIKASAYSFAEKLNEQSGYDFVFADIWHDPTDGIKAYKRLKKTEKLLPDAEFAYWIEKTLMLYL